jgi:hypothetical protein
MTNRHPIGRRKGLLVNWEGCQGPCAETCHTAALLSRFAYAGKFTTPPIPVGTIPQDQCRCGGCGR